LTKNGINYSFAYDYKGNMISDNIKQIASITYDRRNLPLRMTKTNNASFDYKYDDAGQRIYKSAMGVQEFYLRDHTGKELAIYDMNTSKLKMLNLYGNGIIGKVNVTYNAQNIRTDRRQYYFTDHLGSIRLTFDEAASVAGAQDYYPYGEILRSYITGSNVNDKYNPPRRIQRKSATQKPTTIILVQDTMIVI
jgi:hypothetical protein